MARILRPGETVAGYTIVRRLGAGAFAVVYEATDRHGGRVFFKQYKSPTPTVSWYGGYARYQDEIKRRIETTNASRFCYKFIEFFEATAGNTCYFQVFEFVEHGDDLGEILTRAAAGSRLSWDQRMILARVMMAGIAALHDAGIVHCDLKPGNIELFADDTIAAKYRLKLVDFDWSLLADRRAPWHGFQGYVTSPTYSSPEHLRAEVPTAASDIFTCGLMLYQLLAGPHPYGFDSDTEYGRAVLGYTASLPAFPDFVGSPSDAADLAKVLRRCLDPQPAGRPTAVDVLGVLRGGRAGGKGWLRLVGLSGATITVRVPTDVGRNVLAKFGPDTAFLDAVQFSLEPTAGGWYVVPRAGTTNETLLNGKRLMARSPVHPGDTLAVGRESTGAAKLPMTVELP